MTQILIVIGIALSVLGQGTRSVRRGGAESDRTALLRLKAPPQSQIFINGVNGGVAIAETVIPFDVPEGQPYLQPKITLRLPGGEEINRELVLRPGQHVTWALPNEADKLPKLALQIGHSQAILSIAVSSDGRWGASASYDGRILVWDLENRPQVREFKQYSNSSVLVAFVPPVDHGEKEQLVSLSSGGEIDLWDVESGKKLKHAAYGQLVCCGSASPNGKYLAIGDYTQHVWFFDMERFIFPKEWGPLSGFPNNVGGLQFSPDSSILYCSSGNFEKVNNELTAWDVNKGVKLKTFDTPPCDARFLSVSADGTELAAGCYWVDWSMTGLINRYWTEIVIWNTKSGEISNRHRIDRSGWTGAAFWNKTHEILFPLVSPSQPTEGPCIWNPESDAITIGPRTQSITRSVHTLAPIPGSKDVLCGYNNGSLTYWHWNGEMFDEPEPLAVVIPPIQTVRFNRDGSRLLTAWLQPQLWDWTAGRLDKVLEGEPEYAAYQDMRFTPDDKNLLGFSGGLGTPPTLTRWNEMGQPSRYSIGNTGLVGMAVTDDGDWTIGVGGWGADPDNRPSEVRVWQKNNFARSRTLKGHQAPVLSVASVPDKHWALTGDEKGFVVLWDLDASKPLRLFMVPNKFHVQKLAVAPDGKTFVTAQGFDQIHQWSVDGSTPPRKLPNGPANSVTDARYSSDGSRLLVAATDNTLRVWDVETGALLRKFDHPGPVKGATFDESGDRVLSGSLDGMLRMWDVPTGDLLASMFVLDNGRDWIVVTPEGLFDGSAGGRDKVFFRAGEQNDLVPLDRFFQDFYRPGLLADLTAGMRPMPADEVKVQEPPKLRIVSPKSDTATRDSSVTLEVEVTDAGGGISGPWLVHNGSRLATRDIRRSKTTKVARDGKLKVSIPVQLAPGRNVIEVRAASQDGGWESQPARVAVTLDEPSTKADLFVVTVGVNKYAEPALNLESAKLDADSIAKLFDGRGKSLYERVHVSRLFDGDATRESILTTLKEVAKKSRPQDTLVVFFAGHGLTLGQRYYFIPHETDIPAGSGQVDEAVRNQGLPIDVIGDVLLEAPALKRILIFDTCQSGSAVTLGRRGRNPFAFRGAIERLSHSQGVFILAAAGKGEEAAEVTEYGHGLLTYSLLAALKAVDRGPLKDQWLRPTGDEPVVGVLEWFSYATIHVPQIARNQFGLTQEVQMSGEGASFPLLPLDK